MIAIVENGQIRLATAREIAALLQKPEREDDFPSAEIWKRYGRPTSNWLVMP